MYPETRHLIEEKRQAGVFPGAVFQLIENELEESHTLGSAQIEPTVIPMQEEFLFDVASLTKVVCTTTVMLRLKEAGKISWDQPPS